MKLVTSVCVSVLILNITRQVQTQRLNQRGRDQPHLGGQPTNRGGNKQPQQPGQGQITPIEAPPQMPDGHDQGHSEEGHDGHDHGERYDFDQPEEGENISHDVGQGFDSREIGGEQGGLSAEDGEPRIRESGDPRVIGKDDGGNVSGTRDGPTGNGRGRTERT